MTVDGSVLFLASGARSAEDFRSLFRSFVLILVVLLSSLFLLLIVLSLLDSHLCFLCRHVDHRLPPAPDVLVTRFGYTRDMLPKIHSQFSM